MPTIYIDHQPYEVREGLNLLQAVLELGINLPYFCWHPALGSVGACRQCAVKLFHDANDTKGRILMACMTPAAINTYLSIEDPEAHEFRASVTEWMMENHPHDCPVCDEGSECHLQDMTVMTGHDYRRFKGKKRTFNNQDLGPFVNHEMNRCIQCYRCVRFYRDFAGGRDLDAFALHDTVFFGRDKDGVLESEFSGNLVEVCPTGVFTDKTFKKHYTRKWDLQTAPSICVNCSIGCNTIPGERYGMLRRIRNRYNGDINGYFLCDRGRYGYEFVNSEQRIRLARCLNEPEPIEKEAAVQRLATILSDSRHVLGIGSPRASLESNFALRTLVGPENFYQGVSETEHRLVSRIIDVLQNGPARSFSLNEVAASDAVLILGEDVSNTAPMLALALRQSVRQKPLKQAAKLKIPAWDDYPTRDVIQNQKGPLFSATLTATRIDDITTATYHGSPQDIARLGFAVAHEIDAAAPEVEGLTDEQHKLARVIGQALKDADKPLIISGTSCGSEVVVEAAANAAWALCKTGHPAGLCYAVPESNSMGLGLIGGKALDSALQAAQKSQVDALIILENDLFRRMSKNQIKELFNAARHVILLDTLENPTAKQAEFELPAATFAEASGTLVNNEGRAQRFYQVFVPGDDIQESWHWLKDILDALGRPEGSSWSNLDNLQAAMAEAVPVLKPVLEIAPPASFRMTGAKIPRQPPRWSGRTAITANISVHEPKPPDDPNSPLAFTMEGATQQPPQQPPSALIARFWSPGWNSIQALNKFQSEIAGPLRGGDPGCRLIEPASGSGQIDYFSEIPEAFKPRPAEWLVVPLYHIYGSEELSMLTPGIAEQAPQPYLAMNPVDATVINGLALQTGKLDPAQEAGLFELTLDETTLQLPLRLDNNLPRGLIGMPSGLPGLAAPVLPAWGKLDSVPPAEKGAVIK
jgi:NADH-quinone oxidoreductase subunit G